MEEEKLDSYLEKLEEKAGTVLLSMEDFHKLWCSLIYEDYASNNFKIFGKQDTLHISVYSDWKYKSDTMLQILRNLKSIFRELRIVMAMKKFDKDVVEEINLEIQMFLKAVKSFEVDKYAIEFLLDQYKKEIQVVRPRKMQKEKPLPIPKENSAATVPGLSIGLPNIMKRGMNNICKVMPVSAPVNTRMKNDSGDRQKRFDGHISDLTRLSQSSVKMNTDLKSFGLTISTVIQNIQINKVKSTDSNETLAFNLKPLKKKKLPKF
ncbi:hypothetical protein INT48_002060 [Thamnidium elegans]|uniref:Uncharacterized protein n=1 Tax=Thamnidium elegans TaxID=101142 RepID=A0A8H7VWG0_9FUNG|nr:hypothetical protein INT48_002060 [Thamnidium elegans]